MLSGVDRKLIEYNAMRWKFIEAKHDAIRRQCGLSPIEADRRLLVLLEDPDALAEFPTEIRRLVRLRDARRGVRMQG